MRRQGRVVLVHGGLQDWCQPGTAMTRPTKQIVKMAVGNRDVQDDKTIQTEGVADVRRPIYSRVRIRAIGRLAVGLEQGSFFCSVALHGRRHLATVGIAPRINLDATPEWNFF